MGILEQIASDIAEIKSRLAKCGPLPALETPDWIPQRDAQGRDSPLGRRTHCRIVRERRAQGKGGAEIVGKKHLLSPEALAEELALRSARHDRMDPPPASGDVYSRIMSVRGRKGST